MITKILICITCTLGLGALLAIFANLIAAPGYYFWSETSKLFASATTIGWGLGVVIGAFVSISYLSDK